MLTVAHKQLSHPGKNDRPLSLIHSGCGAIFCHLTFLRSLLSLWCSITNQDSVTYPRGPAKSITSCTASVPGTSKELLAHLGRNNLSEHFATVTHGQVGRHVANSRCHSVVQGGSLMLICQRSVLFKGVSLMPPSRWELPVSDQVFLSVLCFQTSKKFTLVLSKNVCKRFF